MADQEAHQIFSLDEAAGMCFEIGATAKHKNQRHASNPTNTLNEGTSRNTESGENKV